MLSRKLYKVLGVALVLLVGLTVAYATLSTTLNITFGNVSSEALSWNVGFRTGTVTGTASGTGDVGLDCGNVTVTTTAVTLSGVTLSKPEDVCTYPLTIENNGGIGAKLATITPTTPEDATCTTASGSTMICGNLKYVLALNESGTTTVPTNTVIGASSTQDVYLVISYVGSDLNSTTTTQSQGRFAIGFQQA